MTVSYTHLDVYKRQFSELTETMCAACGRREHCWEKEYYDTCHSAYGLLNLFSERGQVEKRQVPAGFRRRCIHLDGFLKETNRVMQTASLNLSWQNRLNENLSLIHISLWKIRFMIFFRRKVNGRK